MSDEAQTTVDDIYAMLDQAVRERDASLERVDAAMADLDATPWWRFIRKEKLRDAVLREAARGRYWNNLVGERIRQCEVIEALAVREGSA